MGGRDIEVEGTPQAWAQGEGVQAWAPGPGTGPVGPNHASAPLPSPSSPLQFLPQFLTGPSHRHSPSPRLTQVQGLGNPGDEDTPCLLMGKHSRQILPTQAGWSCGQAHLPFQFLWEVLETQMSRGGTGQRTGVTFGGDL